MHIGGGTAKQRRLRTVPGLRIRPTSGWVRQALFNVLCGVIEDAIFVDLFAGTGSVGLEALSHGARRVCFVEQDRQALQVLHANIQQCAMTARTTVVAGVLPQALKRLGRQAPVDVLFLDPPYATDLGEQTLLALGRSGLLAPHGVAVWQHAVRRLAPAHAAGLALWQSRRYGDTQLSFYRPDPTGGCETPQSRQGNEATHADNTHI